MRQPERAEGPRDCGQPPPSLPPTPLVDLEDADHLPKTAFPMRWCPKDSTALAEAKVEYEHKVGLSIYVGFDILGAEPGGEGLFAVASEPCMPVRMRQSCSQMRHVFRKALSHLPRCSSIE